MSNNCLITKLKGVVDNPDLPIFGESVVVHIAKSNVLDAEKQQKISLRNTRPFTIKAKGNGYFSTSLQGLIDNRMTSLQCDASTMITIYVANETFDISVTESYTLNFINIRGQSGYYSLAFVNLADLKYLSKLSTISVSYTASIGNLADIGGITSFSGGTALTMIHTLIEGSIEDFVAGQVAAGAVSRLDGTFGISKILNGYTSFKNYTEAQAGNPGLLNWDGINRIFLYVGTTSSKLECSRVYETGATAEEIAAWRAEGKTVIDVDTLEMYAPTNS